MTTTATEIPYAAIRAVVDYDWAVEQDDYEEQDEGDREGHVFEHLQSVDAWLHAVGH